VRVFQRDLSYRDAVKMLGADQPVIIKIMDGLGGAALTAASAGTLDALAFFSVRDELVKWGNYVVGGIRDKTSGLNRFDRTQRLVAAHAVIVITAFYEALDDAFKNSAPGGFRDLRLTRAEQVALAADSAAGAGYRSIVKALLDSSVPIPDPQCPYEETLGMLRDFWGTAYLRVTRFIEGLTNWKNLEQNDRKELGVRLQDVRVDAELKYEENYRRLAAEVPEFAIWANLTDHQATRATVERYGSDLRGRLAGLPMGLQGIEEILAWASGQADADRTRTELARRYKAAIESSVLSGADAPDGVLLPTLESMYVNPRCRVAFIGQDALPANEHWWESTARIGDAQRVLTGLLTSPRVADSPLVILGQPGAGKSVLVKMLCARLIDGGGFLPIPVELRSVPADASVQTQIEQAIRNLTGREARWPELAEASDNFPVVLLDGFDELLQATGANRTDYLEQVAEFQRREYELGRPLAVIVTSRTVVADRVRFPDGSAALRLEPLDDPQVESWLRVWNNANAAGFAVRGVQPLPVETVLAHRELARQPLLLLMLALYDARANALQETSTKLSRTELYEQLLYDFTSRELRKHHPHLDFEDEKREVAGELRRLAVAAFAMFNRHTQAVTETDLNRDMSVLMPVLPDREHTGFCKPLTTAQLLIGRFFFIHESRAVRDSDMTREHGYEFLHATFGEFLVAWLTIATLKDLAEERAFNARRVSGPHVDDSFLWAILSFAALTGRDSVVEFADGLLRRLSTAERAAAHEVVTDLLRHALFPQPRRSFENYQPELRRVAYRHAAYSCNLAVLAVLSAYNAVSTDGWDPGLWWSQLTATEWRGLRDTIRVVREFDTDLIRHELWAVREEGAPVRPEGTVFPNPYPTAQSQDFIRNYVYDLEVPAESEAGQRLRTAAFFYNVLDAPGGLSEVLIPYYRHAGEGTRHCSERLTDLPMTPAAALMKICLGSFDQNEREWRAQLYLWCFSAAEEMKGCDGFIALVYRQLREDALMLGADIVGDLLFAAVNRDLVDLRSFLDLLPMIESQGSEKAVLKTLAALGRCMVNPSLLFDKEGMRRARQFFSRYGTD
jgi:hypothetical protein